jgi:hypothetical protein
MKFHFGMKCPSPYHAGEMWPCGPLEDDLNLVADTQVVRRGIETGRVTEVDEFIGIAALVVLVIEQARHMRGPQGTSRQHRPAVVCHQATNLAHLLHRIVAAGRASDGLRLHRRLSLGAGGSRPESLATLLRVADVFDIT